MAGVDSRTVLELLGYSMITMTVWYAHLSPTHLQVAVSRASLGPLAITSDIETVTSLNLVGDEANIEEPEALDDRVETSGGAGRV